MKASFKKLSVLILVVLATFLLLMSNAFAAPAPNFVMSLGTFDYTHNSTLGYGTLLFTLGNISTVAHADGSVGGADAAECSFLIMMGTPCSVDAIKGGSVTFSTFENGSGTGENWIFTPISGGTEFTVKDEYSVTRLTADIQQFTVDKVSDGGSGYLYEVNSGFNEGNVGPINTVTGATSEFMDDVNSFSTPWGELYLKFNFTGGGPDDFTATQSGTITGTFAVVPEPVSSILFVAGGAAIGLRSYRRKRSKLSS